MFCWCVDVLNVSVWLALLPTGVHLLQCSEYWVVCVNVCVIYRKYVNYLYLFCICGISEMLSSVFFFPVLL
jgi:hypothetical protein